MAKLTLSDIRSGFTQPATLADNFDRIEAALENTLSRDGTSPNSMGADLDMSGHRILNLPEPTLDHEPVRLVDLDSALDQSAAAYAHSLLTSGNPHNVTKNDVGLGNVNNTADTLKPISNDTQAALDTKQPLDPTLTALAAVTTAPNKLIYATGSDSFTTTDLSAFVRTILDDTDGAAVRSTIGAGVGSVTSVVGNGSVSGLTLTGSVTSSGNLTLGGTLSVLPSNFSSQTANTFLAAPNGASGAPTFRAIVAADIPTLNQNTTGSAATLTTGRNISMTGDVSWSVTGFNGSVNVTAAGIIQPGVVTLAKMANIATGSLIGRNTVGSGVPEALDATTVRSLLGLGSAATQSTVDAVTNGNTNPITSNAVFDALATKADLVDGLVPANQLPSYVDDVLEFANQAAFPATGDSGKIYVAIDVNKTYRWSGSAYVEISGGVALGETTATAYRGDRGKTAYDHSQLTSGNPHGTTKSDLGLGNVDNTSDTNKPVSSAQLAALNLKADIAGPTFTGTVTIPTLSVTNSGTFGTTIGLSRSTGRPVLTITRTGTVGTDYPKLEFQYAARYDSIEQTATGLAILRNSSGTPQTYVFTSTGLTFEGSVYALQSAVDGKLSVDANGRIIVGNATDVTLDTNFNAQFKITGSGYTAAIGTDSSGTWIGNNSGARSVALVTNKTRQLIVDGSGNVQFAAAAYQQQGALRVNSTGVVSVGVPTEVTVAASPYAIAATTLRLNLDVYTTPELVLPLLSSVPEGHVIRVTAHGIPEKYQKSFTKAHSSDGTAIRPSYSPTTNVENHYLIGCGQVIEYTKTGAYWRAAVVAQGNYEEILLRAYKLSANGGSATATGTGAWALYPDVSGYPDADSRRAWGRKAASTGVGDPQEVLTASAADYLVPVAGVYHIAAKTDATCATAGTGAANEVHAAISNNLVDVGGPGSVTEKLMAVGDRTTAFVAHHASVGPGTRIVGHFWAGSNLTVNEPNSYLEVRLLSAL